MSKEKRKARWLFFGKDKYTYDTIDELVNKSMGLAVGEVVTLNGYYSADDGATHKRVIADTDDGSGVELRSGKWANIVHNGEVNVSWFGAKGDGKSDDTQSLNAFFSSNAKIKNFEANKTYIINSMLNFEQSNVIILGNNSTVKLKDNVSGSRCILYAFAWNRDIANVKILNLNFDGNKDNQISSTHLEIIRLACGNGKKLHNIYLKNCYIKSHIGHGIGIYNENSNVLDFTHDVVIENCTIEDVAVGICQSKVSTSIIQCNIKNTGAENITIDNGCSYCKVLYCKLGRYNHAGNIGIDQATNIKIIGNTFNGADSNASSDYKNGISVNSRTGVCEDIIISNNNFINQDMSGIEIGTPWSNGEFPATLKKCIITGNTFKNNTYDIYIKQANTETDVKAEGNIYDKGIGMDNSISREVLLNSFKLDYPFIFYIGKVELDKFTLDYVKLETYGTQAFFTANVVSKDNTIPEGWTAIYNLGCKFKREFISRTLIYDVSNGYQAGFKDVQITTNGDLSAYWVNLETPKGFNIQCNLLLK